MAPVLVVNADDLGVTRGATLGVIRAHREGIVTSASLAVTTPFYGHALETCVRTCRDLGVGLHFTLTSGRPASDARDVPLLVDRHGFFRWRFLPLLVATRGAQRSELLRQVGTELESQITRLIGDGVRPDHIDGERHVHLIPGIFERVVEAARRHGVPFVRAGEDIGRRFLTGAHRLGLVASGGVLKSWLLSRLVSGNRRCLDARVRSADYVASYLYSGRSDLFIERLVNGEAIDGVTEVMVHPGVPEESAGAVLGNQALERYLVSEHRRLEMNACIAARPLAARWQLMSYRRLAEETAPR